AWLGIQRAGTPLVPLATCVIASAPGCQGSEGRIIRASSDAILVNWNYYGHGRGPVPFLVHLWKVAVPGWKLVVPWWVVANEYDYPLGLGWLLWVVFFVASLPGWIRART